MATNAEQDAHDGYEEVQSQLREKILHALEIFPFLSISGLHQQIGTSTPRGLWQPIVMTLVGRGEVCKTEVTAKTPLQRMQSYTLYHLPHNIYTNPNPDIQHKQLDANNLPITDAA